MRVLLHPGPYPRRALQLDQMSPTAQTATLAMIAGGSLACLPDGCICEPVEVFRLEVDAHEHRRKLVSDDSEGDYRVILNTDVTV